MTQGKLGLWNDKPLLKKMAVAVRGAFSQTATVARVDSTNPNDPRSFGIDISYWNGAVDWQVVKTYSPKIVYTGLRASVGLTYRDSKFVGHMAGAKVAGILRMPYHYFYPTASVSGQIDLFLSMLAQTDKPEIGIVADIEDTKGLSYAAAAGPCEAFCKGIRDRSGQNVIIYSRKYFIDPLWNGAAWLSTFDWWIANYLTDGSEHKGPPLLPKGVTTYIVHQTSGSGAITGVESLDCDHNRWNGPDSAVYAYVGQTPPTEVGDSEKLERLWSAHPELWL